MTEPSTDQCEIPLSSLRLLVSPLRLMSAALWGIVQHRAVKHYGLLEDFITAVHDNIPGLLSHSERLHILLGLRAKMVLEMCNHDDLCYRQNIEPLLSKMDDLMKQDDGEFQSKWKAFTQVAYSMLDNPLKWEMSYQKSLLSEFDNTFDSSLQTLVGKFFLNLDNILPVPSLDQTSLWLRLCPSVLKECEDILDQPEPLSNLLQHHQQNSTFSTGLYSSDCFPSFSDSPDQQVESNTIPFQSPDSNVEVTDGTEDCAPSVEVTLSLDDEAVDFYDVTNVCQRQSKRQDSYICPVCGQNFETFNLLTEHSASRCSGDRNENDRTNVNVAISKPNVDSENMVCPLCGEVYTHKTLLEHQKDCTVMVRNEEDIGTAAQSFTSPPKSKSSKISQGRSKRSRRIKTCSKCGRGFTRSVDLISHMRVHREECGLDLNNYEQNFHQPNVNEGSNTRMDVNVTDMNGFRKDCQQCLVLLRRLPSSGDVSADNSNGDYFEEFEPDEPFLQNQNLPPISIEPCNINANVTGNNAETNSDLSTEILGESEYNTSTNSSTLKCTLCELTFSDIILMKRHYFSLHRDKGSYPCPSCKRRFVRLCDMVKHHQNKRLFQCDTCQWCFTQLILWKKHKLRLKKCATPIETCGKKTLLKHRPKVCQTIHKPVVCTICNKKFSRKDTLKIHMNQHTGGFSCALCGKVFFQKVYLKRHMDRHNGEEPHVCEVCGKGFATPATLKIHMVKHTEDRPFKCDQCDKSFKRMVNLKAHFTSKHTELRPHVCGLCGVSYKYREQLVKHTVQHTGIQPYSCPKCGRGFITYSKLKRHKEKDCEC